MLVTSAVYDLPLAPLTTISLADWRRTMAVNLDFGLGRLEIGDDCLDERIRRGVRRGRREHGTFIVILTTGSIEKLEPPDRRLI